MFWFLFSICLVQYFSYDVTAEGRKLLFRNMNFDHVVEQSRNNRRPAFVTHDATVIISSTSNYNVYGEHYFTSTMKLANYTLLKRVFTALDSILNFYSKYFQQMNLDAIVATRMVQGQLHVLLSHVPQTLDPVIKKATRQIIRRLLDKTKEICNKAIPRAKVQSPYYFKIVGAMAEEGFWEVYYKSKDIIGNSTEEQMVGEESDLTENFSDKCIAELLGTTSVGKPCGISENCWKVMTKAGQRNYYVTHQALYIVIGKQAGCEKEMKSKAKKDGAGTLESRVTSYCNSIMKEALYLASTGIPDDYSQDLFIEEAVTCGILGFRNFFRYDWLQKILSWQAVNGCYKYTSAWKQLYARKRRNRLGLEKSLFRSSARNKHLSAVWRQRTAGSVSRVRREDKRMNGGCSAHKTAVAAGTVTLYIRYILEAIQKYSTGWQKRQRYTDQKPGNYISKLWISGAN